MNSAIADGLPEPARVLEAASPLHLATAADALWTALSHAAGAIDNVLLDWDVAFGPQTSAWTLSSEGSMRMLTLRAGAAGAIALRARKDVSQEARPDRIPVTSGAGHTVPADQFGEWLSELDILAGTGAGFTNLGDMTFDDASVELTLAVDDNLRDRGLALALTAAFGLPALARSQLQHAGDGGMRPIRIERLRRHGSGRPRRVIAQARTSVLGHLVVDAALIDVAGTALLSIEGATFLARPFGQALAIIDSDMLLEGGAAAARQRLADVFAHRIATIVAWDGSAIPLDEPLAMLGVDSLSMAEMVSIAEVTLGIELPPDRLSGHSTIGQFAATAVALIEQQRSRRDDVWGFGRAMNPALHAHLAAARLDRAYVRAQGSTLIDSDGREVIDLVAQFGALPFGFNPPEIWDAVKAVQVSGAPSMTALSVPVAAVRLAQRLIDLAPGRMGHAYFCSTGAETVESAIKLGMAATGRTRVLSTHNAFHGLTLGALSASGRPVYQQSFGSPIAGFDKVPYGDLDALARTLAAHPGDHAVFIVEPIQAEGGIILPPAGYLRAAGRLCHAHGVVFVIDEIQTGLGRCGRLFASESSDSDPDVLLLAKALGGGLMPFAGLLYRSELATDAFMLRHGSTFSNNTLGCAAAMRTLDLLTANDSQLLYWVQSRGAHLMERMRSLQRLHPTVIENVRGEGYLIGVAFASSASSYQRSVAGLLCRSDAFSSILASYLLDRHGVRVAPAGSGTILRIEPALNITPSLLDRAADAFAELADVLDDGDSPALLGHLIGIDPPDGPRRRPRSAARAALTSSPPTASSWRFAFLVHLMDLSDIGRFDDSLAGMAVAPSVEARRLMAGALRPTVLSTFTIQTPDGRAAAGDLILIPLSVQELLQMTPADAHSAVLEGAVLAAQRGAQIVGLGGFCSVVTDGGMAIAARVPVPMTNGNALTAVTSAYLTRDAMAQRGTPPADRSAMVIGALGSIGSALVRLIAPHVGQLILIGRPGADDRGRLRLQAFREQLLREWRAGPSVADVHSVVQAAIDGADDAELYRRVSLADDPSGHWSRATCVFTATSATGLLVDPAVLAPGAVVCDISRPINIPRDLATQRPDVLLLEGGVLAPQPPFDCGIDLGIGRDRCYACMAETMLLALEQSPERATLGPTIDTAGLPLLAEAAERCGMRVVSSSTAPKGRE
jgi:acetylornithine/succinyldiaminopimelate/putrescine aminotransferase/predicted amino acid dehydrogenase/acyl carrier protein